MSSASACQPDAGCARLVGLRGHGGEGAVELLGAALAGERLQRVEAEAAPVRVERGQPSRAADVGDPGSQRELVGDFGDRAVGDAEEDELGIVGREIEPALAQARSHRRADASSADHVCSLDHVSWLQFQADTGLEVV